MKKEIEDFVFKTINDNELIKINEKLYLKKYQKDLLDLYHIDYTSCADINSLLFLIEEVLDEDDDSALEEVALDLQELEYYQYTHK